MKTIVAVAVLSSVVWAGSSLSAAENMEGWKFTVSPYLWAVTLDGDAGNKRAGTVSLDMSVEDVSEVLDSAAILAFEAMKDNRWIFLVDGQYLALEDKQTGSMGNTLKVEFDTTILGGYVGYRLATKIPVDLLLGVRYIDQKFEAGLLGLPGRSEGENWVDALGGLRVIVPFNDQFGFSVFGTVGGGGSNLTWDVFPLLYWNATEWLSVKAGYRAMYYDYDKDNYVYDVTTKGFVGGVSFRF